MSRRDEHELITKAELSEDEKYYLAGRGHLAMLREQYQAMPKDSQESLEAQLSDEKEAAEEQGVSVEEFVEKATIAEIKAELDERDITYNAKASKTELGQLLINAVRSEE